MASKISMGARREVLAAVVERYRSAGRKEKGRILDELTAVTGWHRKQAVRALSGRAVTRQVSVTRRRGKYESVSDALTALWEASDRVCGKRLKAMIPVLLPALERHNRLRLSEGERALLQSVSAATIDRKLVNVKIAAAGGRRRRMGFYTAIRREVPIRTFNNWHNPPPGFCEIDMVAHGGASVAGSFIQTLTMVDVATGWTECLPLITRDGSLVVEALARAQNLIPWLIRGADFDNDSAFMNDAVVPWCRSQNIEVTRSRAYKKNDQPSKLDPHLPAINAWLTAEPQLTALAIVRRLAELDPVAFSDKQHSTVQRLLRSIRRTLAARLVAMESISALNIVVAKDGGVGGAACDEPSAPPTPPSSSFGDIKYPNSELGSWPAVG